MRELPITTRSEPPTFTERLTVSTSMSRKLAAAVRSSVPLAISIC
jgi:hypothetical protein